MFPSIIASIAEFARREDGRTAVEYAIAINVVIMIAIAAITASGYNGRHVVTKVCDGAACAYESTQQTVASLLRRGRGTPQAADAGHIAPH